MEPDANSDVMALMHCHQSAFRSYAMVGNAASAKAELESIEQIVRAAVTLKLMSERAGAFDAGEIAVRVRPYIVLRQSDSAYDILQQALHDAGILRRPLFDFAA